jgi:hypothetical protein
MKFCSVVPEICREQVHASRKERIIIIIKIIIRNRAKTISPQTLFGRLNKELNKVKESGIKYLRHQSSWQKPKYFDRDCVHLNDDGHFKFVCSIRMCVKLYLLNMYVFKQYKSSVKPLVIH